MPELPFYANKKLARTFILCKSGVAMKIFIEITPTKALPAETLTRFIDLCQAQGVDPSARAAELIEQAVTDEDQPYGRLLVGEFNATKVD